MIWHLVGLSGICREWFGQKWCHCTVRQLWVEQQHKLCWGHSPIESTVQSQSMPYATGFVCCALAKKWNKADCVLSAIPCCTLSTFFASSLWANMLMVIPCFLMLVCHGLPRAMSQISSHFFLLGTNTARPWQIALRATAVWWSFISPATTSVIVELRRLCLGLPLVSGEWATVSVAGLCWSCGNWRSSRGWGWSLCATPRSLWGAGLDLVRSSRKWSFQSIKTFHILSYVHPDAGQQKKESLRWHCEW